VTSGWATLASLDRRPDLAGEVEISARIDVVANGDDVERGRVGVVVAEGKVLESTDVCGSLRELVHPLAVVSLPLL
jgi:hypothetical protein